MTEKRFTLHKGLDTLNIMDNAKFNEHIYINKSSKDMKLLVGVLNELHEENQRLKSDLARVIEQSRKNNELCVSDIRILEKALWCSGCENDYDRLRQLRKEFLK